MVSVSEERSSSPLFVNHDGFYVAHDIKQWNTQRHK